MTIADRSTASRSRSKTSSISATRRRRPRRECARDTSRDAMRRSSDACVRLARSSSARRTFTSSRSARRTRTRRTVRSCIRSTTLARRVARLADRPRRCWPEWRTPSIGTDTGGSIRIPAAACGLVGLKPTIGEIPIDGIVPLSESFDHAGPLCLSVEDAALLYGVLRGIPNPVVPAPRDVSGLRFGIPAPVLLRSDRPSGRSRASTNPASD